MTQLIVKDGCFSVDGSNIQFLLSQCEKSDENDNSYWIPNGGVNILGKSIFSFTNENYAVIFPGVKEFPQEEFLNKMVPGKILNKASDDNVPGKAVLNVCGGGGKCLFVKCYIRID